MLTLKVVFSVPDAEVMSSNGPSSLSIHEQEQISAGIAVKSMWNQRSKRGTIWRINREHCFFGSSLNHGGNCPVKAETPTSLEIS